MTDRVPTRASAPSALDTLKGLPERELRSLVLVVLGAHPSRGCSKAVLVSHVCRWCGVSTLRGGPREAFRRRLNASLRPLYLQGLVRSSGQGGAWIRLGEGSDPIQTASVHSIT